MWTFWGLAVQIVAGFLGAHAAAGASHEHGFGFVGHSLAGLVGGALSGAFLQTAAITVVTGSGSLNSEVAVDTAVIHVITGAVAGAIAMFAVAIVKKG
jgi:hypothetical protein